MSTWPLAPALSPFVGKGRDPRSGIVIAMHIFTRDTLDKFLTQIAGLYQLHQAASRTIVLSRAERPEEPEVLVLPGRWSSILL